MIFLKSPEALENTGQEIEEIHDKKLFLYMQDHSLCP